MLRHRFVRQKTPGGTTGKSEVAPPGSDGKAYRDRYLSPSRHLCSCQGLPSQEDPELQPQNGAATPSTNSHESKDKMHGHQSHSRRRKRRPLHGVKSVDVTRGKTGYGFTISGQHPCVLSCIVSGSPAERAGLKPGDYLVSVNGENVSKAPHDNVVRMIGTSTGTLTLQVAENYNSSDSSDDDYHVRPKSRYPNRVRSRHVIGRSPDAKVLREQSQNARVAQYIQETRETRSRSTQQARAGNPYRRTCSSGSSQGSQGRAQSPVEGLVHVDTKWGRLSSCSASRLPDSNRLGPIKSQSHSKSHSASNLKPVTEYRATVVSNNVRPGVYPGGPAQPLTSRSRDQRDQALCHVVNPSSFQYRNRDNSADSGGPLNNSAPSRQMHNNDSMDHDDLTEHNPNIRGVVGYVGTIEMPGQDDRLQHIRNAVRRLRVEQKIHTLVLMDIGEESVRLLNTSGGLVAEYPADRIVFAGACPDDKRFFGLVTSHNAEDATASSSCHVFMVDPEIQEHPKHAAKAASFNVHCTISPDTQTCLEFPRTACPLVAGVSRLYRERRGGIDADVIRSQIFAEPVVVVERQHSSSSNSHDSDSGLGFSKEDNQLNERVYIVDVSASFDRDDPQRHSQDSFSGSAPDLHHLSPDVSTMPTPHYRNPRFAMAARPSSRRLLNASSTSEESLHRSSLRGKLNPRAMPDPPLLNKAHSNNALELHHSADSMRRSMHKFLQARQRNVREVPGTSSDQESQFSFVQQNHSELNPNFSRSCSHSSIQQRPVSAPFKQLTQGLTVVQQNKPAVVDLSSKLSPRAFLPFGPTVCSPAPPVRSPSAPPLSTHSNDYSSDEEFDHGSLEEKMSRFDRDQTEKFQVDGPRRFSEGFALSKKREKEKVVQEDIQRWTKTGSLRRPKNNAKKVLSQSHESLIVTDGDIFPQQKLLSANSVNSISGHGNKKIQSHESEVGRVAGWAVNFEKLLNDSGGLSVFTEFLKKEFSEENIMFWKICLDYKRIGDPEERKSRAKEIYEKHISSRAAEPVNIDSRARQQCEEHLQLPSPEMFDIAQQQIFQLMKQDSYSRFLRSDLYKSCLMSEIEGKPLTFLEQDDLVSDLPAKDDKKGKKNGEPEVKRRKSLLPWVKNKSAKQSTKVKKNKENKDREENINNNNNINQKKTGFATVDLSLMSKEVAQNTEHVPNAELREEDEEVHSGNYKFCRIILPDGSSTVVCAKPGQSTHAVLTKLCEKRNFSVSSVDVFLQGSDKPLDLNNDISSLGSKDILLEKRVLFRVDLPNNKYIGVKAKPHRSIRDVFKPILHKYGYKIDSVLLQLSDQSGSVDVDCPTSSLDNTRVVVIHKEEVVDWSASDNRRLTNGRPPVPPRTKTGQPEPMALDDLTNKVFEDLMQGKSEMAHNFDELGILDPDRPAKLTKSGEDHRSSGLFGLLRRESLGAKDPVKTKVKSKVTFALQRSEHRKRGKGRDEDNFLDLLSKMQSQRIEDQRGLTRDSLELPEFLVKPSDKPESRATQRRGSACASLGGGDDVVPATSQAVSIQNAKGYDLDDFDQIDPAALSLRRASETDAQVRLSIGKAAEMFSDSRTIRNFKTFGSPTEKTAHSAISHSNSSFSLGSVVPSHEQAVNYFNSFQHPLDPDFDDPMLMVKSVGDLGFDARQAQDQGRQPSAFRPPAHATNALLNLHPDDFEGDIEAPKASPEKFSSSGTDLELSSPNESETSQQLNSFGGQQNDSCENGVTLMQRKPFESILDKSRVNSCGDTINHPVLHGSSSRLHHNPTSENFKNRLDSLLSDNQQRFKTTTEKHQSTKLAKKKRMVRVNGASNIATTHGHAQQQDAVDGYNGNGTPKELGVLKNRHSRTRNPVCLQTELTNPSEHQVTFV